jgi:hypothetical protein
MIERCHSPACEGYEWYGARGIAVCERWRHDFAAFIADMGRRPSPALSIDRIDNDGNYGPGNCRWATTQEQGANKRTSRLLTCDGTTLTITEWAGRTGLHHTIIRARIKHGWPLPEALHTPARGPGQCRTRHGRVVG